MDHRTTAWKDIQLREGDIVVALTLRHFRVVHRWAVDSGCEAFTLSALLKDNFAVIEDPYGKGEMDFRTCFDLIDQALLALKRRWG